MQKNINASCERGFTLVLEEGASMDNLEAY